MLSSNLPGQAGGSESGASFFLGAKTSAVETAHISNKANAMIHAVFRIIKRLPFPMEIDMRLLRHNPQFLEQKCVVECDLLQVVIAPAGPAVAGLHVGHEEQRMVIGLQRA